MKILKRILICFSILIFLTYPVIAVSIGVSPGRVRFDTLLQGGYAERTVTITTNTEDILNGHFNVNGDTRDWVSFEPDTTSFSVSKNNPYRLKIIVQPPSDIRNGNYSGNIEFVTDTIGSVSGRAGGIVKAAITLLMNSEVSGDEIIDCRAGAFIIDNVEIDFPLTFGATIINDGNVRIRPTISLDIWDQLQEELLLTRSVVGDEVLPTTQMNIRSTTKNDLDVGQYWVNLRAEECNSEGFQTFSVIEKGGIADKGELTEIFNQPFANVGDTIEIIAKFQNNGERDVNAKFKGSIRSDDKIVEIIETEEIIVPKGQIGDFNIFFVPEKVGRYVLTGRVVYNKKLTFEKSTTMTVNSNETAGLGIDGEDTFSILPLILYVIIAVTILFITRKILVEKRKKKIF